MGAFISNTTVTKQCYRIELHAFSDCRSGALMLQQIKIIVLLDVRGISNSFRALSHWGRSCVCGKAAFVLAAL